MAVRDYTRFKGWTTIKDDGLMNEIEINLKMWLEWCFLGIGAWSNVQIPASSLPGGRLDNLHWVSDPAYTDGQVWETPRLDLIYETGVNYDGSVNPIAISGVWINNSFYPPGHATYGHYLDYKNGHIIFNTAISKTSTVRMNYSYRDIQVEIADNSPLWKELQDGSFNTADTHLDSRKGEWTGKPAISRQQMPAIIIECVPTKTSGPYELGNGSLKVYQDILFHVVAENRYTRNKLVDVLAVQNDKAIWGFNTADVAASSAFPLDSRGARNGTYIYPALVEEPENNGFRFYKFYLTRNRASEIGSINPNLHQGVIRCTIEVVFGDI